MGRGILGEVSGFSAVLALKTAFYAGSMPALARVAIALGVSALTALCARGGTGERPWGRLPAACVTLALRALFAAVAEAEPGHEVTLSLFVAVAAGAASRAAGEYRSSHDHWLWNAPLDSIARFSAYMDFLALANVTDRGLTDGPEERVAALTTLSSALLFVLGSATWEPGHDQ